MDEIQTYLGADGLAYCKICGEPVEVEVNGKIEMI
mgnify:FL=1